MRIKSAFGVGIATVALAVSLAACGSNSDSMAAADTMSSSATADTMTSSAAADKMASADTMDHTMMSAKGTFAGLNGKKVAGEFALDGHTLKVTNYSSDEGPDLHLYLANGTDEAAIMGGKQVATIAFDQASQTFDLTNLHPGDYKNLVVYCNKAKAVFGAADLA